MPKDLQREFTDEELALKDRRTMLHEVADLMLGGSSQAEAVRIVGIDILDEPLPIGKTYVPTPDQIAAACLEIQATWSVAERKARCVFKCPEFALQRFGARDMVA